MNVTKVCEACREPLGACAPTWLAHHFTDGRWRTRAETEPDDDTDGFHPFHHACAMRILDLQHQTAIRRAGGAR